LRQAVLPYIAICLSVCEHFSLKKGYLFLLTSQRL
jgi:hypothetical protein